MSKLRPLLVLLTWMGLNAALHFSMLQTADLIVQPEAGRGPWLRLLDGARTRVRLVTYRLSDGPTLEALERAHQRGVDVQVILHKSRDNEGARNRLGERARWGNPDYAPLTHQKTLVVDETAWVLTHNLTRVSFEENRGFAVALTDRGAVDAIVQVFEADWERRPIQGRHRALVWTPGDARARICELVNGARRSIELTNEHLEDLAIEDALIAAARRGVAVRVLMTSLDPGRDRNERGRQRLRDGGCAVRLVERPFMHAKMLRLDGTSALVGSTNISRASLEKNRELSALVNDARVLAELGRVFEGDWGKGR